jgi:flagellar basal-body rod protein FlgC
MDYHAAFNISASGMAIEKMRVDATAANLANLHTSAPAGSAPYQPLRVLAQSVPLQQARRFDQAYMQAGGARATLVPTDSAPRLVLEPGHPHADANGYVTYAGINHSAEMSTMAAALRAYEANVVAMNAARTMAARTLDIGGQR